MQPRPANQASAAPPGGLPLNKEIDELVLEYLAYAGFVRTTQQLKEELRERQEGKTAAWRPSQTAPTRKHVWMDRLKDSRIIPCLQVALVRHRRLCRSSAC